MYKQISFTETRKNLAGVLNDVFFNDNVYVVTKRSIPIVRIENVGREKTGAKRKKRLDRSLFGMWKDKDIETVEYSKKLREELWK